jgi:4-amino-4-deoxy-L-arabinose transferase-like glycosyltransferase
VVDSFDHARPLWWYLPMLPVLLFPWVLWPRLWLALARWRGPLGDGERFLLAWLVPTFLVFCLVSGKQVYYLLPLLPGAAMALARALSKAEWNHSPRPWLGGALLGLAVIGFGAALLALPWWVAQGRTNSPWLIDAASGSPVFGAVFLALGLWLAVPRRDAAVELRRIALAGLLGTAAAHALFARTLWHFFDLSPTADALARLQAAGRPLANLGTYEGQFHFHARLTGHIDELHTREVAAWAQAHPTGAVVTYASRLAPGDLRYARLIQPFRSKWLLLWDAPTLATLMAGATPPEPRRAVTLFPPDYWRYRQVAGGASQVDEDSDSP